MKSSLRTNFFEAFGFACLALLLLLSARNTSPAQTASPILNKQLEIWKTFSPAGNNFKASLPAVPRELEDNEKDQVVTSIKNQVKKS